MIYVVIMLLKHLHFKSAASAEINHQPLMSVLDLEQKKEVKKKKLKKMTTLCVSVTLV